LPVSFLLRNAHACATQCAACSAGIRSS
jgi:hypothetical protein